MADSIVLPRGKKPARPGAVALRFGDYFNSIAIPVPAVIDPPNVRDWRMLGNDTLADCVQAGAAHETMAFVTAAGRGTPLFTNRCVLADYAAVNPDDPTYMGGTDVQQFMSYRRKTGIIDGSGMRHLIDVYAALEAGNIDQLALAVHLFGAVGVGVRLPDTADDQFRRNEVWDVKPNAPPGMGHYISLVGLNADGNLIFVSWGRLQCATPAWVREYMDEGVAVFSRERLNDKGLSPEGYDANKLTDDFNKITGIG